MDIHLSRLEEHLNRAVLDLCESMIDNIFEKENNVLKSECNALEDRLAWLERSTATHDNLISTNERFIRRNNIRIVGVKHSSFENGIDITSDILKGITNNDIKIERSYRDGNEINGKDRHILVKFLFTKTKSQ